MPAKKVSHQLHIRINELLDRILDNETAENSLVSQLNLGSDQEVFVVSMESFFELNFDLDQALEDLIHSRQAEIDESATPENFSEGCPESWSNPIRLKSRVSTGALSSCEEQGGVSEDRLLDLLQKHWDTQGERSVAGNQTKAQRPPVTPFRTPRRAK